MSTYNRFALVPWLILAAVAMLFIGAPPAVEAADQVGTVTRIEGAATVSRPGGPQGLVVKVGTPVYQNDTLTTEPNAKVRIVFIDKSVISVGSKSSLTITEYVFNPQKKERSGGLRLLWGKVKCYVNDVTGYREKKFNVTTETAVIGVRGTVFVVEVRPDGSTFVAAYENDVFAQTAGMEGDFVIVVANTATVVEAGQLPAEPQPLTEEQRQLLEEGMFEVTPEGDVTGPDGEIIFDAPSTTYESTTTTTTTTTSTTTTTTTQILAPIGGGELPGFPGPPQ